MVETSAVRVGNLVFDVRMSGPADGRPVLALHGFPQSGRCWDDVAERLADAGMRVIAPDQRGYSPRARPPDVADYALPHLVGDALGLLDALGLDRADVVGHDWGAAVAWELAVDHPDRVRTLTAVSVPHPAAFGWAREHDDDQRERSGYIGLFREPGRAERVLLEDGARRLRATFAGVPPERTVDGYVRALSADGALTAALNWYRAMDARPDGPPGPVTVPTTYVWSTADAALGRAGAERCGEHVRGPYEFVVLDEITHWVPEQAPDRLAEVIMARVAAG